MKYNTTYTPKINLKKTIYETDRITNIIIDHYKEKYNMTSVLVPSFLDEQNSMLLKIDEITRVTTFDFADNNKIGRSLLTPSNWMRNIMLRMNLKEEEGVYAQTTHVWRDIPENPLSTPVRYNLTFQIKISGDNNMVKKIVKEHVVEFYKLIAKQSRICDRRYKNTTNFPDSPSFITSQQMENEYPDMNSREKEIEFANELNAFVFSKAGKKLFSGHVHTWIPPQIYDLDNFYQIVIQDNVNNDVLKVASIALLASGETLDEQLNEYNLDHLKTNDYYQTHIKQKYNIIEIKINIGRLIMGILQKGHISEVVPGVISDSANLIKDKYKIDKY